MSLFFLPDTAFVYISEVTILAFYYKQKKNKGGTHTEETLTYIDQVEKIKADPFLYIWWKV